MKKSLYLGFLILVTALHSAEYVSLGDLIGPSFSSEAHAISADGSVVVGMSKSANGDEAFRWTQTGGMLGLSDLTGGAFNSTANAVNADGSVVVGMSTSTNGDEAFRWTQADGMLGLGDLTGGAFNSTANAVNADGSVVVGMSTSTNGDEAFRWTQADGMLGLGDLTGGAFNSTANAVNADGSVVVGISKSANGNEAFRWTQADGMVGLGALAGISFYSAANAVNADGSVVVGMSTSANGIEAFRWTQTGGMVGLGDLAGDLFYSEARAISANGSVVVGFGTTVNGREAFRWIQNRGMKSLTEWLADDGYTLTGWTSTIATGVSADGSVVVGSGTSNNGTEAFLAQSKKGLISINDFHETLWSTTGINSLGLRMANTIIHGNHRYNRELSDQTFMWANGDFGHDNNNISTDVFQTAEVGIEHQYNDYFTSSFAVGKTWSKSDLIYEGNTKGKGVYFILETDIRLSPSLPIYTTFSYVYGKRNIDIKRGYENAGSLDKTTAETNQNIQAFSTRVQYQTNNIAFFPYVEYNIAQAKTDAYAETGKGFPVRFNASKELAQDVRIGFDTNWNINSKNLIIAGLEGAYKIDSNNDGVSGEIIDLFKFNLASTRYKQTWLEVSLGIEHKFKTSRLSLITHVSTESIATNYSGSLNYSIFF